MDQSLGAEVVHISSVHELSDKLTNYLIEVKLIYNYFHGKVLCNIPIDILVQFNCIAKITTRFPAILQIYGRGREL